MRLASLAPPSAPTAPTILRQGSLTTSVPNSSAGHTSHLADSTLGSILAFGSEWGARVKLAQARIQNYRSILDTGWFGVEDSKTILVGPNEAGKTVLLRALQHINSPEGVQGFIPLRDYPRRLYSSDIQSGRLEPSKIPVVSAKFKLEPDDVAQLPDGFDNATYSFTRYLGNNGTHRIEGGPQQVFFDDDVRRELLRLTAHIDERTSEGNGGDTQETRASLKGVIGSWDVGTTKIEGTLATQLQDWLYSVAARLDDHDHDEIERHTRLLEYTRIPEKREKALSTLRDQLPVFVYFNNYFRVRPNLHLLRFAERQEQNLLDDAWYDYGSQCLLDLLGFTARELAQLGTPPDPGENPDAFEGYRAPLDERRIQLNAASVRLTNEIRSVWNPNPDRAEANILRVQADRHYLTVVVEDEMGVEIELDQRSEGFQWLVSFFVVFFAEAEGQHANAVLLLDEPGLSLHGLKQREFRQTVSRLAEGNQTLYTTHSPFLVGPNELDLVRVVEMVNRETGTKVHTTITAGDPAALLPLQEALGYDLAQSLFTQQRNLVLEGLTDYWYLDATAHMLREAGMVDLNEKIALIQARSAGKVVYFATILHANSLKVAALLDSDNAGDAAAAQETLVHTLGNTNILRTADFYQGSVRKPEIEDLLRDTLIEIAKAKLAWDVADLAKQQSNRPIINIFTAEIDNFSKYRLAKEYLRWTRDHEAKDLSPAECAAWKRLITRINKVLK